MRITIKDVAKLAGVSTSTASLALNNQHGVKPETRDRVMSAAKKLKYRPNQLARGLVTNKTHSVQVIVSGPQYGYFSSPVLFEVIKGISDVLGSFDYRTVLSVTTVEDEVDFVAEQIDSGGSDGIILWGSRMGEEKFLEVCSSPIPTVAIGRYSDRQSTYAITLDDRQGGYLATSHLLELGHSKIAFIGDLYGISSAQDRLKGYKAALRDHEVDVDQNLIVPGDFYQESGYWAMRDLLAQHQSNVTAVFAASDLMAVGAIKAAMEAGLSVPGDIAIIGFDNIPISDLLLVPLSTISTPIHQLGEEAARKIIKLIRGESTEFLTRLDVELLVRKST